MNPYPLLAQRLFNAPIALHRGRAQALVAAMAEAARAPTLDADAGMLAAGAFGPGVTDRRPWPGYDMIADTGIALIRVDGVLLHRLGWMGSFWGLTGYDGLRQAFLGAIADEQVRAIMLDVDSPGGEVAGCFDLVDAMFDARGEKPVWAVLNECAYSAAYALASAADRIVVPRTGGTGSIGVIAMHVDVSKGLADFGVKVTFITSEGADRKTDGHSEIPLSDEAYRAFKTEIDEAGRLFDETVARNRGLTSRAVNDLKAATFQGGNGLRVGLADAVMAPDAAYRALLAELG